jgi:hypothetical protein
VLQAVAKTVEGRKNGILLRACTNKDQKYPNKCICALNLRETHLVDRINVGHGDCLKIWGNFIRHNIVGG